MSTSTGPGTAAARQEEGLVDRPRDFQRILDHEGVLDDRHRDADRVGLLEAVGAEQLGAYLTGDEHDRDGIHHRVADRRDQVGRAWAARGKRHAHLARGLGVALGRMSAAGLVAYQDVAQATIDEGVVGREVGATGQAEDDVHALRLQAFHHCVNCTHCTDLLSSRSRVLKPQGPRSGPHFVRAKSTSGFSRQRSGIPAPQELPIATPIAKTIAPAA